MDTRSATAMFDVLRKKLTYTSAYSNLQSMLLHLLQLPCMYIRMNECIFIYELYKSICDINTIRYQIKYNTI